MAFRLYLLRRSQYYCHVPSLLRWQIAHTTNMAHISTPKLDGISSVNGSLGTLSLEFNSRDTSRRFGTTWTTVRKPPTRVLKLAVLSPLQEREAPRLQQGLPGTVGLPHRLHYGWSYGWWQQGSRQ